MVRTYKRKYTNARNGKTHAQYLSYSEEALQKAIEFVQNGTLKVKEAAEKYKIPVSTLSRKYRHKNCTQEKAGHPTLFSKEEEKSFVEYVQLLSHWGFPLDSMDLRVFAQKYLNKIGKNIYRLKNNLPGIDWARNFLSRHKSEISNRTATNISSDRAKTTEQVIDDFFKHYEKSIEGVSPDCIINYDETNLTDDPGNKKYIFKRGCKYPERVINSSKSSISLMFAGTADGQSFPIYVVYKADHLWDQWLEGGPEGTRYNRSKSGWFDSICFENWFDTVIVPYAKKKPGRKVVIGDNLSSHFSQSVLQTCNELNVMFICLPPKTTHLLQPLDVAYYAPLKRHWRDVLTKWKKTEGLKHKTLVKSSFPKLLKKLKTKLSENGMESNNLIAGFSKCGLYPINSERPKSRLPQRQIISEEEIENTTSSVVIDILQEMRSPTSATVQTKRKKKCNVPPGMSITAEDLKRNMTEKCQPFQQQKKKKTQKKNEDLVTNDYIVDLPMRNQNGEEQSNLIVEEHYDMIAEYSEALFDNIKENPNQLEVEQNDDNLMTESILDETTGFLRRVIFTTASVENPKPPDFTKKFINTPEGSLSKLNKVQEGNKENVNNNYATSQHMIISNTSRNMKTKPSKKGKLTKCDKMISRNSSTTSEDIQISIYSDSDINCITTDETESIEDNFDDDDAAIKKKVNEKEASIFAEISMLDTTHKYSIEKVINNENILHSNVEKKSDDFVEEEINTKVNEKHTAAKQTVSYRLGDTVLTRYYSKNNWKYYVGVVTKLNYKTPGKIYGITYYRTVNKNNTVKFIKSKRCDYDEIPDDLIVKEIDLIQIMEDPEEYVLNDDEDKVYF